MQQKKTPLVESSYQPIACIIQRPPCLASHHPYLAFHDQFLDRTPSNNIMWRKEKFHVAKPQMVMEGTSGKRYPIGEWLPRG